jgi:hypothetical protein
MSLENLTLSQLKNLLADLENDACFGAAQYVRREISRRYNEGHFVKPIKPIAMKSKRGAR